MRGKEELQHYRENKREHVRFTEESNVKAAPVTRQLRDSRHPTPPINMSTINIILAVGFFSALLLQ